jgi:hypothetical protein
MSPSYLLSDVARRGASAQPVTPGELSWVTVTEDVKAFHYSMRLVE